MGHKMEELKKSASFEEICALKKDFIKLVDNEIHSKGVNDINAKDCGEVVDMIKDLAEAEKNCMEACYYQSIVKAMADAEEDDKDGYNRNRYANGQYAPKGRGSRSMGFMPYLEKDPWMPDWTYNPDYDPVVNTMGYAGPRRNQSGSTSTYGDMEPASQSGSRRGYDDWDPDRDPQHSMSYNEYRKAKRHYTETKSPSDKQMMDEKSRRHIHEALDTFKDIWKDADPAMRKELKASMQQAINEMPA